MLAGVALGAGDTVVNVAKDLTSWNLHSRMGDMDKKKSVSRGF